MNWLTITTTLIAAIAPSVVSIVATCHQSKINKQNNNYQLELNKQNNDLKERMYYLENYYSNQNKYMISYIDALTNYLIDSSENNLLLYKSAMAKTYMYVSGNTYNQISSIDYFIERNDLKKAQELLSEGFYNELLKEIHQNK